MTNVEIIDALKRVDLSNYPYDEVKGLVSQFAPKFLRIRIPKGQRVERIRPDVGVFERKEVSYRPATLNIKPQRATLPGKTAFYGTLCHVEASTTTSRYIMLLEASKLYRAGITANGVEHFTWSRWEAIDEIRLAVVVDENVFVEASHNQILDQSKQEWNTGRGFIDSVMQSEEYNSFVASQFAKLVNNDFEYIISATVADMLMYVSGVDGVMYPPVQAAGDYGMNVAIRPDVADSKLKLTDVSEMEYVQANGKGQLKFTRHGIPLELDNHGVKRWRY